MKKEKKGESEEKLAKLREELARFAAQADLYQLSLLRSFIKELFGF